MSEEDQEIQATNALLGSFSGMTSQVLLELIARASTLTLKGVIKAARVPPEELAELLKILIDERLVSIEGNDTFDTFEKTIRELAQIEHPTNAPDNLICGVPTSVIERRRELIQHLPEAFRSRHVTITTKGFGKAFAL